MQHRFLGGFCLTDFARFGGDGGGGKRRRNRSLNNVMTEEEIKELIINFNLDESINDLKRYYSTPTTWEIIKQARRETSHTLFLSWFFNNKDFNADPNSGPIKKLIVLLLKWHKYQTSSQFDQVLENSIYAQDFEILSSKAEAEFPIDCCIAKKGQPAYGEGSIDIFITCEVKINNINRCLHIVIENKIDASETTKSFDQASTLLKCSNKSNVPTTLYQTDAYYDFITTEFKADINIFAYLKPTKGNMEDIKEAECNNKNYIQINYQEILDNIIQPIYNQQQISSIDRFRLQDYIKTLGKPSETDNINNITIMAMEEKERTLLKKFFENNEELIRAAIESLGDSELTTAMQSTPKVSQRLYCINTDTEKLTNVKVIEEFVKMKLDKNIAIDEINKEMNSYMSKNSQRINVCDNDGKVFREDKHCYQFEHDGTEYKVCMEWSDKDDNSNFAKLRQGISKQYKDFQIYKIS